MGEAAVISAVCALALGVVSLVMFYSERRDRFRAERLARDSHRQAEHVRHLLSEAKHYLEDWDALRAHVVAFDLGVVRLERVERVEGRVAPWRIVAGSLVHEGPSFEQAHAIAVAIARAGRPMKPPPPRIDLFELPQPIEEE